MYASQLIHIQNKETLISFNLQTNDILLGQLWQGFKPRHAHVSHMCACLSNPSEGLGHCVNTLRNKTLSFLKFYLGYTFYIINVFDQCHQFFMFLFQSQTHFLTA